MILRIARCPLLRGFARLFTVVQTQTGHSYQKLLSVDPLYGIVHYIEGLFTIYCANSNGTYPSKCPLYGI